MIYSGLALGYADEQALANGWLAARPARSFCDVFRL
jgi:hypothetical protein